MDDAVRERGELLSRLARPMSYPERDQDRERFLHLDAALYRDRLPALTDDEVRREYLSLADRLAAHPGPGANDEALREAWESRQSAVASVITQRSGLPDLSAWVDLINFDPSRELAPGKQALADASGPLNLDYYAVAVTRPPVHNGLVMSPPELLDAMRANLNAFVGDHATFWDLGMDTGFEGAIPRPGSADELGKQIHIDMGSRDDGTVVVTENEADHWRLSTVFALTDMEHPVSGTREWGVVGSADSPFTVYVRGVDRPTGAIDAALSSTVFAAADTWWRGWQQGVADFVVRGGGGRTAAVAGPQRARCPHAALRCGPRFWGRLRTRIDGTSGPTPMGPGRRCLDVHCGPLLRL